MAKNKLRDALKRHLEREKQDKWQATKQEKTKSKQSQHKHMVNSKLKTMFKWSDGQLSETPFRPDANVLVVGDGDFSFSLSLSRLLSNNAQIVATVYDSEEEYGEKYGRENDSNNVQQLRQSAANVHSVLFSVDACNLHKHAIDPQVLCNLDAIVFNFPHTGSGIKDRSRNIRGNQLLLSKFFLSCRQLFDQIDMTGRHLTVSCIRTTNSTSSGADDDDTDDNDDNNDNEHNNNSEDKPMPMVMVTCWCGDPYDDWRIKSLAKAHGFTNCQVAPFHFSSFPGYKHQRTDGADFTPMTAVKESRVYLFSRDHESTRNTNKNAHDNEE